MLKDMSFWNYLKRPLKFNSVVISINLNHTLIGGISANAFEGGKAKKKTHGGVFFTLLKKSNK